MHPRLAARAHSSGTLTSCTHTLAEMRLCSTWYSALTAASGGGCGNANSAASSASHGSISSLMRRLEEGHGGGGRREGEGSMWVDARRQGVPPG